MAFRRLAGERDPGRPDRPFRPLPDRADEPPRPAPIERSVLALQSSAGNAAVARAVQSLAVQRQKKKPPAWAAEAKTTLKQLFPKEKLLEGIVIKDFADLNPTTRAGPFDAWTNSPTDIYVKDPALIEPDSRIRSQALAYVLQHEANHVRQFQGKGPPKEWEKMLWFEKQTYKKDLDWLAGAGKQVVTDKALREKLTKRINENLTAIERVYAKVADVKRQDRDLAILDAMLDENLVPENATADPRDLYKQP